MNCGVVDIHAADGNDNYHIPQLTVMHVAWELERWAKWTRRLGSEGIMAKACRFTNTDATGITRQLKPEELLRDIFGSDNLMSMAVTFEWSEENEWTFD